MQQDQLANIARYVTPLTRRRHKMPVVVLISTMTRAAKYNLDATCASPCRHEYASQVLLNRVGCVVCQPERRHCVMRYEGEQQLVCGAA